MACTAGQITVSLPPTAAYGRPPANPRQGWWAHAKRMASGASRTRGRQTAVQAEQPAPCPAPQGGRIGQAMGVFGLRSRLLPNAAVVRSRFPGLFPAAKAVEAVGRRPVRQDGEGQSTGPAHAAADPNPVVAFVVGLFPPSAMTDDGVLAALRTPSWQERQRKRSHPGSDLSSGSGSAIKRITAGVKARR